MTISDQPGKNINKEISGRTMARMLDLGNVFELVKDGLNQSAFAEQEPVRQGHQAVLRSMVIN